MEKRSAASFFVRWTLKPGLVSAAVESEWPASLSPMSNPPFFALTLVFTAVSFPRVFCVLLSSLKHPRGRSFSFLSHTSFFFSIKSCWRFRVFCPALVIVDFAVPGVVLPKEAIADHINHLSVICRNPSKSIGRLTRYLCVFSLDRVGAKTIKKGEIRTR